MEVTKDNFNMVLPSVEEELKKCDFYTFDLEMTGINLPANEQKQGSHNAKASPGSFLTQPVDDCIFQNKDLAARKFNIIQMGLSLFTKVKETPIPAEEREDAESLASEMDEKLAVSSPVTAGGTPASQYVGADSGSACVNLGCEIPKVKTTYTAKSFNFYLFPSFSGGSSMGAGCQKQVVMDAETVGGFLTEHGMDFTKWISKGIPYVTAEEASAIRERGTGNIDDFTDLAAKDGVFGSLLKKAQVLAQSRKSADSFDFPYFPNMSTMNSAMAAIKMLGLKKVASEGNVGKKRYLVQVDPSFEPGGRNSSTERSLGAYRLYEAMVKCQKPLIAHNSLSDLLFLFHAFHSTPPKDYAAFKAAMHKDFPVLFDTRTLATLPQAGFDIDCVGNLGGQYRYFTGRCAEYLEFQHDLGFDHFHPQSLATNSRGAHEAAYDAYMTGCLFLALQLKLSGTFAFDDKVMANANLIAVFGSCVSTNFNGKDKILNTAPILFLQYPKGTSSCSARQVDSCFGRCDLRGRVMSSQGGAVIYCGYNSGANSCRVGPTNPVEFDEQLASVKKHVEKAFPGSKLWVLCDPTGMLKAGQHIDFPVGPGVV